MSVPVDVAVAVLFRADGRVLLARRPQSRVYAGYWEFPGGKVEAGEEVANALAREIREELGIAVEQVYPWITREFSYPHARVRLHFFRVHAWRGNLQAHEHDSLAWEPPDAVGVAPLLPANGPVLRALQLPDEYAISQAGALGRGEFLSRLDRRLAQGLRLVQLREPGISSEQMERLAHDVLSRARVYGARVLVNADITLARRVGADGVHLTSQQLRVIASRPDIAWVGASCHTGEELRMAEQLGADFAVLGPVLATPSHPDGVPLGWEGFRGLARGAAIPVFALGGMNRADMETAWSAGAHGVAMLRGAWRDR